MHKIAFILVSLLIPLGLWSAGCRQETARARIPDGPDTARLARAPGKTVDEAMAAPPNIPALIDPEVLAAPDQPTFARIRAVMDREAALASNTSEPGLFVLPRQDYPELAIVPVNAEPVNSEIWSRQVAGDAYPTTSSGMWSPEDLAAMVPATTVVPTVRPLEAYPSYSMPSDMPGLSPLAAMPAPAPAIAAPSQTPAGGQIDIPGMYFGPDNMALSALAPIKPIAVPQSKAAPDFFGDPDLGLLAPVGALDDLSTLLMAGQPGAPARTAISASGIALSPQPAVAAPVAATAAAKTNAVLPPGFLDISALITDAPSASLATEGKTVAVDAGSPSTALSARAAPSPAGSLFGEIVPPAVPKAAVPLEPVAPPLAIASSAPGDDSAWEAFKPPVKLDRQSHALDPLIDYDFSAFSKKEERPAQKIKLTPAETMKSNLPKRTDLSTIAEPEAPPLL